MAADPTGNAPIALITVSTRPDQVPNCVSAAAEPASELMLPLGAMAGEPFLERPPRIAKSKRP